MEQQFLADFIQQQQQQRGEYGAKKAYVLSSLLK